MPTTHCHARSGFTLIELLAGTAILLILMLIIFTLTQQTGDLWRNTNSKIASFQGARAGFDALVRNLGQATLNSYPDYYDSSWKRRDTSSTAFVPGNYGRSSDLQFVCGPVDEILGTAATGKQSHAVFFQAPLGRAEDKTLYAESSNLLNAVGYYVEFADTGLNLRRPKFLSSADPVARGRFRLMEWIEPAEKFPLYDPALRAVQPRSWFLDAMAGNPPSRVMAENILALVLLPRKERNDITLAPAYSYDSDPRSDADPSNYDAERSHLLPPLLQITLVALDRDSADRLARNSGSTMPSILPSTLFRSAAQYGDDLEQLQDVLNSGSGGAKLNYRIFSTTISTKERP